MEIINKYKRISNAFYTYALDDFLTGRLGAERMKLIFLRYFVQGIDLAEVAKEVQLSGERTRQIAEKCLRIIEDKMKLQCDILAFTKSEAEKANILAFELKRLKDLDDLDIERTIQRTIQRTKEINIDIDSLDISVRAYNILKSANIKTIGDLASFSKDELRRFRNCGNRSIEEFEEILSSYGLKFKE